MIDFLGKLFVLSVIAFVLGLAGYTIVGTEGRVQAIKAQAPAAIANHNWNVIGYEGYQRGSWSNHGGKVWYHVEDNKNPNIRYRVYLTQWNNEIHFYYNDAEVVSNVQVAIPSK